MQTLLQDLRYGARMLLKNPGFTVNVKPLDEERAKRVRKALLILLAAAGFVLLTACVNVANLILARAAARWKETAIRAALGARRWRLMWRMALLKTA